MNAPQQGMISVLDDEEYHRKRCEFNADGDSGWARSGVFSPSARRLSILNQ
jgi:hypothetical protein